MTVRSRFLAGENSPPPPERVNAGRYENVSSDFVIICTALICALFCVLGLIAVSRCTWIRWFSSSAAANRASNAAANKGLKKKVLNSLPKLTYGGGDDQLNLSECPICLSEFAAGEEIRVLPQCGHGFHVGCIDTWLVSHSSCPSCRQVLVGLAAAAAQCQKCGGGATPSGGGVRPERREDYVNSYLP